MVKLIGPIFREQKEEERRLDKDGFIDISKEGYEAKFHKLLARKQQEYVKAFKPFCMKCALNDFEDAVKLLGMEWNRKRNRLSEEYKYQVGNEKEYGNVVEDIGDLDKYGDPKHFKLLSSTERKESDPVRKGHMITVGYDLDYVCKKYDYGVTVFIPIEMWEKEKQKKKIGSRVEDTKPTEK